MEPFKVGQKPKKGTPKVIHQAIGTGIRCHFRSESMNATTALGEVTCKRCIKLIHLILLSNVKHAARLSESLPPMYQGCGLTREDLALGLKRRREKLAAFEKHHKL